METLSKFKQGVFNRVAHNEAAMGYYPTDDATMEAIAAHFESSLGAKPIILDPCCGEGRALVTLQDVLGGETYGVELEAERAELSRACVDHVVHASYDDMIVSNGAFNLLFLNPPYGSSGMGSDGKTHRLEIEFLERTYRYLNKGGYLVYVVPYTSVTEYMATLMAMYFEDVSIYKGQVDTYKQMVFIGRYTGERNKGALTDSVVYQRMMEIEGDPSVLNVITSPSKTIYDFTETKKLTMFKPHNVSVDDIQALLDNHDAADKLLASLTPKTVSVRSPIAPVTDGHLGAVVAAGWVDGTISLNGVDHEIKGTVRKMNTTRKEGGEDVHVKGDNDETVVLTKSVTELTTLVDMGSSYELCVICEATEAKEEDA